MTPWRVPASSDEPRSSPTLSSCPLRRIQSRSSPQAPQRSTPEHSGSNPPWASRSPAPGRPAKSVQQDPADSARSQRRCATCSRGWFVTTVASSPASEASPSASTATDRISGGISQAPIQNDGHDALLRVTIKVEPRSSPSEVEQLIDDLLQHARRWVQVPLSLDVSHSRVRVESFPNRTAWESSVATAVTLIRQGALDKLVLAREEQLLAAIPFSPITALARLRRFNSAATLFAMQSGRSWLLGASPERLVRLHETRVDVTCLAGSIGMGHDDEERRHLADQLLSSKKDREEHEIVVRSTMCALAEVCEDVTRLAGTPRIATARAVQHLETPVSARMSDAGNILDLVERLHPTPAVGGYPSNRALSIMRELEVIDRGWYAGPFGWTDLDGSGEFVVAIRSALLSGRIASVFAGSGIVADSVPAAEYEETSLKLRPMLAALGAA